MPRAARSHLASCLHNVNCCTTCGHGRGWQTVTCHMQVQLQLGSHVCCLPVH
jgi:hypothetical protein